MLVRFAWPILGPGSLGVPFETPLDRLRILGGGRSLRRPAGDPSQRPEFPDESAREIHLRSTPPTCECCAAGTLLEFKIGRAHV